MTFEFNSAKGEILKSDIPISIKDLQKEMEVSEEQIRLLVKHGWLRVLKENVVAMPRPAGMRWLKQTLGPLAMIPFLPTKYAKEMLELRDGGFKKLVLDYNIQIYLDEALGELISVASFHRLFNALYPWHERSRYDRQMLLSILLGIDSGDDVNFVRPMKYDAKLEEEISRIAKLKEPLRTIRATELLEAYRDAKTIASVSRRVVKTTMQSRVESIMRRFEEKTKRQIYSENSSDISSANSSASRSITKPSRADCPVT